MTQRRHSFFVRSPLLAVAFAVFMSGCSSQPPVQEENEAAVNAVKAAGGSIVRDENQPGKPVVSVTFEKATDAALKELAPLRRLTTVTLAGTQVSNAGLKELTGLPRLRSLDLSNTPVTDAGLKELTEVKNLHHLVLTDTQTTDAGVSDLQKALPYCTVVR